MDDIDSQSKCKIWTPCEDLLENFENKDYAVVILNCHINLKVDHRILLELWSHAKLRVTVDGGTKRWLNWLQRHQCEELDLLPPDLITGDMDSLPLEVLEFFEAKGQSKIVRTPDQDETDFTKSLKEIQRHCDIEHIKIDTVFVLADTCGRFDQIIANINTLYKANSFLGDKKIYQIASCSITWLLTPGNHRISIPELLREKQEWCALLPLGAPCIVSSKGLKWNLDKRKLEFGGMVSTSNTYCKGDENHYVIVSTDGFLTWSMGIESLL